MKQASLRLLASAALVAAAAAIGPLAHADAKETAAPAGAAADQADSRVPAPPAGKGVIVFFRPFGAGMALNPMVREGADDIVKLGTNSYFVYVADPGAHAFEVKSEATDTLHMEVDAGETYYVKETIGMGVVVGRPHLTPSDAATFAKLKGLKLSHQTSDVNTSQAPPGGHAGTN